VPVCGSANVRRQLWRAVDHDGRSSTCGEQLHVPGPSPDLPVAGTALPETGRCRSQKIFDPALSADDRIAILGGTAAKLLGVQV